jgi:hypothetical protein
MTENKEPENNGNKGTGNDNRRNQGGNIEGNFEGSYNNSGDYIEDNSVRGINNFLNNTLNFVLFGHQANSKALTSAKHSRIRQALLKQVKDEVEIRINSSLHNRVYIVLDADQNPEQIELPWASEIKVENKPKIKLDNTDIISIFDQQDVAGRLLILGQPGSGKTTMLLKLAEELVNRAENNPTHPVPVLFSLSSWKNDNQSIKDWLVDQLKDKYGLRKDIGKQWINNQEIIPLLDGLDELVAERQEKCVIKINRFLHPSNWKNPVIVCSRIEEYQRYETLLQLNNSLELDPFTLQQVYQYLQSTDNFRLWNSISRDTDLRELAKTPLLLNILVLSFEEISIQSWQQFKSSQERLSYLLDAYIRRMFKRKYKGKDKQPKSENTKRWLSWLAQRIIEESSTEFFIERIQSDWLKKKNKKVVYDSIISTIQQVLIYGLIDALLSEMILKLNFGQFFEIISHITFVSILSQAFGLMIMIIFLMIYNLIAYRISIIKNEIIKKLVYAFFGLIFVLLILSLWSFDQKETLRSVLAILLERLIPNKIQTVETIKFSWKKSLLGLIIGLIIGLILKHILARKFGSNLGLLYGLIYGLILGFDGVEIENKTIPNQGIRQSITNTIIISSIICLPATLFVVIVKARIQESNIGSALIFNLVLGLSIGVYVGIFRSGIPAIKHFILRVILWSSGYIPWNYAKFLNYCTERLFLQRVGGSYRFMHDLLRQHFANSYGEKNLAPVQAIPVEPSVPQVQNHIICSNCGHNNAVNCKYCIKCGTKLI